MKVRCRALVSLEPEVDVPCDSGEVRQKGGAGEYDRVLQRVNGQHTNAHIHRLSRVETAYVSDHDAAHKEENVKVRIQPAAGRPALARDPEGEEPKQPGRV